MSLETALRCHGLIKEFNGTRALNSLDLTIPSGVIFGLLGPNGSGKTTTIRCALGIYVPDDGNIEILGSGNPLAVRDKVGYLPEERGLYPTMRVREQLAFLGSIRGLRPATAWRRAGEWLERLELGGRGNARTNELSKGMQQKVQFAAAILHQPRLLVLDEPFSGLDPINSRLLSTLILELRRNGTTIILSTHRMEQVEQMCDSISLIDRGKAVLAGPLAEIKATYGRSTIAVEYDGAPDGLHGLPEVMDVADFGRTARLQLHKDADPQVVLRTLAQEVNLQSFRLEQPSIEDIYLEKVRDQEQPSGSSSNTAMPSV